MSAKRLSVMAAVAILLLFLPLASAQSTSEGKIISLTVAPKDPLVYDPITATIGVNNPSDKEMSYKLEFLVTKDGEILLSTPFTFTLQPGLGIFFSPSFVSKDIGQYEMVAKLSDQYGLKTMDIQLKKINVISEIGPFDIAIDSPSDVIYPGTKIPLILTLANMGEKATDIQVRVTVECNNGPDIEQEFFVFMYPGAVQDRQITSDTCNEKGPHDVTASVIVFNKTWISALNQIFLNEPTIGLNFEPPQSVMLRAGKSAIFDVRVTNTGEQSADNLQLLLQKIPREWVQITPAKVVTVEKGQTVIFIVNITPPADTLPGEIKSDFSAAADQVLERRETGFTVLSFDSAAGQDGSGEGQDGQRIIVDVFAVLQDNLLYIGGIVVAGVGGMVASMAFGRSSRSGREEKEKMSRMKEENIRRVSEALRRTDKADEKPLPRKSGRRKTSDVGE
jgi:hypothetical protein